MCCELYYRGSQANYQLCMKQESDRERKKEEGGRERGIERERGECVLFKPVYSDFCKVPLCLGDCTSEVSPMGP